MHLPANISKSYLIIQDLKLQERLPSVGVGVGTGVGSVVILILSHHNEVNIFVTLYDTPNINVVGTIDPSKGYNFVGEASK